MPARKSNTAITTDRLLDFPGLGPEAAIAFGPRVGDKICKSEQKSGNGPRKRYISSYNDEGHRAVPGGSAFFVGWSGAGQALKTQPASARLVAIGSMVSRLA